jgi:hypothetical protein
VARQPHPYRKLPGKWFKFFGKQSLWQGPDHLIWVEGNLFSERYKRFFYKDIQALVVCRANRQTIWTIVWSALLVLCAGVAWMVSGVPYVSATLALLWAILLFANLLLGPACDVYLQTAVQIEKLSSLVRLRTARKTVDQIKSLAQRVQGALDPLAVAAFVGQRPADHGSAFAQAQRAALTGAVDQPYHPRLHWILFGLLTALGLLRGAQFSLKWVALAAVDVFGLACTVVLIIVVLVRSHRPIRGSLVAAVDWLSLGFAALHCVAAYAFFIAASFRNPGLTYNYWAVIQSFLALQVADYTVVRGYGVGVAAASMVLGILGILGLLLLAKPRQRSVSSPPSPSIQ